MFELINYILYDKKDWNDLTEEEKKSFNAFQINRWLSQIPKYINIVNKINGSHSLSNEDIYNFYKNNLEKRKIYIKFVTKSKDKYSKELITFFANKIKESKKHTIFYLDLFTKEEITHYLGLCGFDDKEIKKLLTK